MVPGTRGYSPGEWYHLVPDLEVPQAELGMVPGTREFPIFGGRAGGGRAQANKEGSSCWSAC
eukprot:3038913-Pyramimonas_sp.AAC.1